MSKEKLLLKYIVYLNQMNRFSIICIKLIFYLKGIQFSYCVSMQYIIEI